MRFRVRLIYPILSIQSIYYRRKIKSYCHHFAKISRSDGTKTPKQNVQSDCLNLSGKDFRSRGTFTRFYGDVKRKLCPLFAVWHFFSLKRRFPYCIVQYVCPSTTPLRHFARPHTHNFACLSNNARDWFVNLNRLAIG